MSNNRPICLYILSFSEIPRSLIIHCFTVNHQDLAATNHLSVRGCTEGGRKITISQAHSRQGCGDKVTLIPAAKRLLHTFTLMSIFRSAAAPACVCEMKKKTRLPHTVNRQASTCHPQAASCRI